ncbi:hypothetical protein ICW40_05600 [Actinotalea ferrariae]|uniref:hypothetical protein n=1 Tax=Actinotalea ferrariae TaxID=1386098 RepID=UPI001C8B8C78|nr:hypothetical protein [Actinotalea ferrariae]MBX9244281.1 hypothetical protein [Actinotalea ferrariae]
MADRSPAAGVARQGLGPGLTTFLVVDVILVVTFVILLVMSQTSGGRGGTDPTAAPPETSAAPETTPEASAPAEPDESEALPAFVLPSGNIWCQMDETSATCTILEFSFTPPEVPEGCAGTIGNVLTVTAGQDAGFLCLEGPPAAAPEGTPVLDYGGGSTIGEMTCLSSQNGVFCRHNPTGTGFSLARAGTQLF